MPTYIKTEPLIIPTGETEEEKAERKKRRLADCGKYIKITIRPETGEMRPMVTRCGLLECIVCRKIRANRFKIDIIRAVAENPDGIIYLNVTSETESKRIVRLLDRSDYRRLPQNDESGDMFFIKADKADLIGVSGKEFVIEKTDLELDWEQIICYPEGKRSSGNLGKNLPEEKEYNVDIPVVSTNADHNTLIESIKETLAETIDMNPKTEVEVNACMTKRASILKEKLKFDKIYVEIKFKKGYVDLSRIEWKLYKLSSTSEKTKKPVLNVKIEVFDEADEEDPFE